MHENLTQEEKDKLKLDTSRRWMGVRQEAVTALLQQEQQHTQQRAQGHAQAVATIQQIERQAQCLIYEVQGARQKGRQEREMMKAEEQTAKQAEKKARQIEQTIKQREQAREQQTKQQTK